MWRVEVRFGDGWRVVPPADYSLSLEEARALAEGYTNARVVNKVGEVAGFEGYVAPEPERGGYSSEADAAGVRLFAARGVLGGAYRGRQLERASVTHYYDVTHGRWGTPATLCGRVKEDHLNDENEKEPATCPICVARFERLKKQGKARWVSSNDEAEWLTMAGEAMGTKKDISAVRRKLDAGECGCEEAGEQTIDPRLPTTHEHLQADFKKKPREIAKHLRDAHHVEPTSARKGYEREVWHRQHEQLHMTWDSFNNIVYLPSDHTREGVVAKPYVPPFGPGGAREEDLGDEYIYRGEPVRLLGKARGGRGDDPVLVETKRGQKITVERRQLRPLIAAEGRRAADYPDLEAALLGAQSKLDATHMARMGSQVFVFSPTSRGYVKRQLFRQGGNFHWPATSSLVADLPAGAMTIHEATKVGWDPEQMPEAPRLPRAAEEARRRPRKPIPVRAVVTAGDAATVTWSDGTTTVGNPRNAEMRDLLRRMLDDYGPRGVEVSSRAYNEGFTFEWLARESVRDNPVEASNGAGWAKITRDPKKYSAAMTKAQAIGPVNNAKAVFELLAPELAKEDQEVFLVLPLDIRGQLRCTPIEVHRGERSRVGVAVPDVLKAVIEAGGEGFVVVHNHPTTKATPSDADRDLTKAIRRGADAIELALVDHVVIGTADGQTGEYYSFTDKKLYKSGKKRTR